MNWLPIERAPFETDKDTGCKWLAECLLLVNGVMVQGMLSAGMWLRRSHEDPQAWEDLVPEPTHWMPKPPDVGVLAADGEAAPASGGKVSAGDLIEAHFKATQQGFLGGTSNWAFSVLRHLKDCCAAPAPAVAPAAWVAPDGKGGVQFGKGWMFSPVQTADATMPLYPNPIPSKVNLNHQVTATLTAAGARVFREWMTQFPARVRERCGAGGQIYMPLWEIAQIFGPKISNGVDVPFVDFQIDFGLPEGVSR